MKNHHYKYTFLNFKAVAPAKQCFIRIPLTSVIKYFTKKQSLSGHTICDTVNFIGLRRISGFF
ncbi:hypothetical protein RIR_e31541_A0A2I1HHU9_9GLOM [Rhizophagus irregularis DAOM 181602=DAOM 197198]|nr:hypothetical protein RIR_e31541_A0A2I1HHU9_9GLOM [Rhizophagus irregularis DAOM 181602=DAOM 197198]